MGKLFLRCVFPNLALATLLAAQTAPATRTTAELHDLLQPPRRAAALAALRQRGAEGARQLLAALLAADRRQDPLRTALTQALVDFGPGMAAVRAELRAAFPAASPAVAAALLHALGDGLPAASADELDTLERWLLQQAQAGRCYSPDASTPTFAWYEFVRLRQRLRLCQAGLDVDRLQGVLHQISAERAGFLPMLLPGGGGPEANVHDLGAFGQHGTREQLEAIAEAAQAMGPAADAVAVALAAYLAPELPRPAAVLAESCAGIGEEAPVAMPAARWPTLWRRDDWRFAIARAVLACTRDPQCREHALRHLLFATDPADLRLALAQVRDWPQPWTGFLPGLAACLDAVEPDVVRGALLLLAQTPGAVAAAAAPLRRLAQGRDPELAARARQLLASGR